MYSKLLILYYEENLTFNKIYKVVGSKKKARLLLEHFNSDTFNYLDFINNRDSFILKII